MNTFKTNKSFLWRTGAFAGQFGDAFIENTDLEGGFIPPAIRILDDVVQHLVEQQRDAISLLTREDVEGLTGLVLDEMKEAAAMGEKVRPERHNSKGTQGCPLSVCCSLFSSWGYLNFFFVFFFIAL
jgi:hypothetical protein